MAKVSTGLISPTASGVDRLRHARVVRELPYVVDRARGLPGPSRRRVLLLIDLENACSTSRDVERGRSRLEVLLDVAGDVDDVVAAASSQTMRRLAPVLRGFDLRQVAVKQGRNAADLALLAVAEEFAQAGPSRFVIASGDHIFAKLAALGDLHVLEPPGTAVSKQLSLAASRVTGAGDPSWGCLRAAS